MRYRYYATKPDAADSRSPSRVAAADLEQLVITRLSRFLRDRRSVHNLIEPWAPDAIMVEAVLLLAVEAEKQLTTGSQRNSRELLLKLISRVEVLPEEVRISIRPAAIVEMAMLNASPASPLRDLELVVPVRLFRRSREVRLAIAPGTDTGGPVKDPALIKLLTKAWAARKALMKGCGASLKEIATSNGYEPGYFTVLVKLGFLAPDIVACVLSGQQPETLTRQQLARIRNLPINWEAQRKALGFYTTV